MFRTCTNEIGVKVGVKVGGHSSSHNHDSILEELKVSLPNHAKERVRTTLEINEAMTPKS